MLRLDEPPAPVDVILLVAISSPMYLLRFMPKLENGKGCVLKRADEWKEGMRGRVIEDMREVWRKVFVQCGLMMMRQDLGGVVTND